jgi:hypothetical protein
MKFNLENVITIVALILTEAWFLKGYFFGKPDFEPAIALILTIGVIFAKDPIKEKIGIGGKASQHDQNLFRAFLTDLPYEPTIEFLKGHDFGNAFRRSYSEPLYNFVATWESVEKEFLNKAIEKRKKSLFQEAQKLASEIAVRTVPVGDGQMASVYSDQLRNTTAIRPDHVIEDARILNQKATEFIPKYEEFVRTCRKKLFD